MPDDQTTQQSISDDQELAKVLAGVTQQIDEPVETTPDVPPVAEPVQPVSPVDESVQTPEPTQDYNAAQPADTPMQLGAVAGDLDSIKLEALQELRPLVDKLNVSPEEKFDTYLLLLRSTDDKDLIAPAHDAAKGIEDEARRAQALLDIIKEIDFLNQNKQ